MFIPPGQPSVAADEQRFSKVLRVGIIGTDTSHSTSFTKILNNPEAPDELKGCRVVVAALSSSADIAESARFGKTIVPQLKKMGVEIVPTIEKLLEGVDVVLLETNDGRVRLEQALPVLKAGKPVFVDKPIAASLADVIAIYEAGKRYKTPVFSSSSLRYTDGAKRIGGGSVGDVLGCEAFSPCPLEKTHPDLFWYGIHGVETLFTIMGPGCESVVRSATPNTDVVVGAWKDGRIGSFRGRRKENNTYLGGYGGTAFGSKGIAEIGSFSGY
ncbi:MAG: dehydrogenase, partial [Planctomycetaceae bacterium]|nr:dehydrogenase [Planctomycetaceae bacterium]